LARAEDEGYVPVLPQPFKTWVKIKNLGSAPVSIYDRQAFITDDQVPVVVNSKERLIIKPKSELETLIEILQLEKKKEITQIATGEAFQEFILGGKDDDEIFFSLHDFQIEVTTGGDSVIWENRQNFRNTEGTDRVYHTFYKMSDELAVRFGNGSTGMIPEKDSVIKATPWHTRGERAFVVAGLELKPVGQILDANGETAKLQITTVTTDNHSPTLGLPQESLESIRQNLLSHIRTGPIAARNSDYEFILKKAFPDLVYLKVWGEYEMVKEKKDYDFNYINKSFFCFLIENDSETAAMEARIKDYYAQVIKPMNVTPECIQPNLLTFKVRIQGKIDRRFDITTAQSKIKELLEKTFGIYANKSGRIKTSDIYQAIISTVYFSDAISQLNRKYRPYFTVNLEGELEALKLNDYIYLEEVTFGDDEGGDSLGYISASG
jgi:hypothetical protein